VRLLLNEILLLLFDASLYYTVFGFWFRLIGGEAPSYAGYLLIAAMIVLHAALVKRNAFSPGKKAVFLLLAVPAAGAAFLAPLQFAFLVPISAYLAFCFYRGMTNIDLSNFRDHFRIGAWILLALVPGVIAGTKGFTCLAEIVPYLAMMLALGVVELRYLRDDGTHALLHGACVVGAAGASFALTALHAPRLLGQGLLMVYNAVIAPILYGLAVGAGYLLYWAFALFRKIGELMGVEYTEPSNGDNGIVVGGENVIEFEENTLRTDWIEYLGKAALIIAIVLALIFVFRRLLARRPSEAGSGGSSITGRARVGSGDAEAASALRLFRPGDPRLAVRYYYAKFLREASRRGAGVEPDLTGSEIERRAKAVFSAEDGAAAQAGSLMQEAGFGGISDIYDIYAPARYSGHEVTEADARRMRDAWKSIRKSGL